MNYIYDWYIYDIYDYSDSDYTIINLHLNICGQFYLFLNCDSNELQYTYKCKHSPMYGSIVYLLII